MGGLKYDDPWVCRTQGKEKGRRQMVKPRLGIAGKALIEAKYQGVPIITQPRKERKIREHNAGMTKTRGGKSGTKHQA